MLKQEREKLRDTDPFTILEYIKSSIEILMNMKMEEQKPQSKTKSKHGFKGNEESEDDLISVGSSVQIDSKQENKLQTLYESQLQKYEAEVRNHIKIEQQLKLHIECVQDKLDETEKSVKNFETEKQQFAETK